MLWSKLLALLQISRPVNVFIGMLSIFIAAFITGSLQPRSNVILACLVGGLVTAAANAINDYFDIEIDRINKPHRVLPAGRISPRQALLFSGTTFAVALFLSSFINPIAFAITLFTSLLLFFYSFRLKRLPLWGNLVVSFSSALAFIFGGVAVSRVGKTILPAIFAFLFHFGREIIKDIQDMSGDARENARTFPLVFGKQPAIRLTNAIFLTTILVTTLPFLLHYYSIRYFWIVLLGVHPVLLYSIYSIRKNQSARNLGFVSNLLKADMLIGLLAIYVG